MFFIISASIQAASYIIIMW